jgi:hypothetical protein
MCGSSYQPRSFTGVCVCLSCVIMVPIAYLAVQYTTANIIAILSPTTVTISSSKSTVMLASHPTCFQISYMSSTGTRTAHELMV